MNLLSRFLRRRSSASEPRDGIRRLRLTLAGWDEVGDPPSEMRLWHDAEGDILSVASGAPLGPDSLVLSDEAKLRQRCRALAESRGAGLIEAYTVAECKEPTVRLLYKRLQLPAYIYTGMLVTCLDGLSFVWTVVARERGTTGVREAIVTAGLMSRGKLTLEGYERSFGQDPYDPAYRGVDRSVLRFMSDDESYDEQFPRHPLTKVRKILETLPDHMEIDGVE